MLDLPLRPGGQEPDSEPRPREPAPAAEPARRPEDAADEMRRAPRSDTPPTRPRRRRRRRSSRARLFLLIVVVAAAVAGWFLSAGRIDPSSTALELGEARVGQPGESVELVVVNGGLRPLVVRRLDFTGEAAADFRVEGSNCLDRPLPRGENCRLTVAFVPRARGPRAAVLEIDGAARNSPAEVAVRGLAQAPQVGLAPERLDFGGTPVDGAPASAELTISNIGRLPLELGRVRITGEHAAEFRRDRRCPSTRLDPGEACAFGIEFAPRVAGERTAVLTIANDSPEGEAVVPLAGQGLWDGPVLAADQTELDFGEQRVGTRSAVRTVRLRNPMPGAVTISGVDVSGDGFVPAGRGCAGASLGPGESCTQALAFQPGTERAVRGALDVRAAESAERVTIPLRGVGVEPKLARVTSEVSFGSTRAGLRSASQPVVFANEGTGTLRLARVGLEGAGRGSFVVRRDGCSKRGLAPEKRCTVEVAFTPGAAGAARAELEVVPAEGLPAIRVPLSGRGVVAGLGVDSERLDFGAVYRTRFEDRALTLTNVGSAPLTIRGLRLEGSAADDYRIAAVGCRLDLGLPPGDTCRVSIRFTPTVDDGRRAELVIDHNGPRSPAKVALVAQGLAPVPVFQASARSFDFGALPQGRASAIETLTLSNTGAGWLDLRRIALRGDHAEDFEIVPGTCDGVPALAPGGSCTVGLRFTAKAAGDRRGVVVVEHGASGSPARVNLFGTGARP